MVIIGVILDEWEFMCTADGIVGSPPSLGGWHGLLPALFGSVPIYICVPVWWQYVCDVFHNSEQTLFWVFTLSYLLLYDAVCVITFVLFFTQPIILCP